MHNMKMNLSKLKKLKMPESKKAMPEEDSPELAAQEEELGMDLDNDQEEGESPEHQMKVLGGRDVTDEGEDGSLEEESMESPEEEAIEESALDLTALSDDELLAEIQKRGIMGKMDKKPSLPMPPKSSK